MVHRAFTHPSVTGFAGLLMASVSLVPVRFFYSNASEPASALKQVLAANRSKISLMVLLAVTGFGLTQGARVPGSGILTAALHASSRLFFPLKPLFSGAVGEAAADLVYGFGRWNVHLAWTYVLSGIILRVPGRIIQEENSVRASVTPWSDTEASGRKIEVYVVTGIHGFLRIPESFCRECHLFVRSAQEAAEEFDGEVDISVRSYWTRFPRPLLEGGYHPPVMLVDGDMVAQGENVPSKQEVSEALESSYRPDTGGSKESSRSEKYEN